MTTIDTTKLSNLAKRLSDRAERIRVLTARLERVRGLKLNAYDITIDECRMRVAYGGYPASDIPAQVIRGREMIHLGAIKVLQGELDAEVAALQSDQLALAEAAGGAA